jgi:cytochrome c oxidase subunit III
MAHAPSGYYVPHETRWPILGSVALATMALGFVNHLHGAGWGLYVLLAGAALLVVMMFGWFGNVIRESTAGLYDARMDRSFRWGMAWFIFSEVMFFAAFFGALFYARVVAIPDLAGAFNKAMTAVLLWPEFEPTWPLLDLPNPEGFKIAKGVVGAWGIPAINTAILLTSGVTVTIAHWGLLKNNRLQLNLGLVATVALGALFLYLQADEYLHAIRDLDLTLASGIYGSTFYMLTGFHGAHVTLGAIMLAVILLRCLRGHFSPEHHFGFEAVTWYWHFVDVVWLGLFVFVYWV